MSEPYTPSTEEDALRSKLGAVLVNAANYPRAVQPHILGRDLGPLISKAVSAVVDDWLAAHDAEVRAEAEARVQAATNAAMTAAQIARKVRESFTAPPELTTGAVDADSVAYAVADFIEGMGK